MDEINDSILKTIAKMMGPSIGDDYFNPDFIWHINAALSRLCQLGVGMTAPEPYHITGEGNKWSEFIEDGQLEEVKQYIWLKVKQVFDPPTANAVKAAYDERIKELEWLMREVAEVGY